MRFISYARLCVFINIIVVLVYFFYILFSNKNVEQTIQISPKRFEQNLNAIHIAVVSCGDRIQETLTMLKSAIMLTSSHVTFVIVTETDLMETFNEKLTEWKELSNTFSFKVMPLTFPSNYTQEWKKLFKPCASQRLFLPSVLNDVDSVLYVDTDTLFLSPVEDVWDHFSAMNSTQLAALAPEHEDPNIGWYNRFARHPYYGKLGVNSGVMLMNLTRMRKFKWVDYMLPIYKEFKLKITWGDQDIINIIFHYHPDKLYVYSCRYNFRPDHCMYMSVCHSAEKEGVAVLHGSRGFFHSEKQPVFQMIYKAFEEFQLNQDFYKDFYQPLEMYLDLVEETNCGHIKEVYLKNIKNLIQKRYIIGNI